MRAWMMGLFTVGPALAGCTTTAGAVGEAEVESIVYETGPCFGACPVYRLTVGRDGSALFEGRRFTAVTGERRFSVTPAQYSKRSEPGATWPKRSKHKRNCCSFQGRHHRWPRRARRTMQWFAG